MIFGIGIDSVTIDRIRESMCKETFAERVFSPEERAFFVKSGDKHAAESAAASFAGKEAFLKATGRGLGGFALGEIAVLRKESGAPYLALSGGAAAYCEENGITAHISLTHENGMAVAFVLLEKTTGGR